MNNIVKHDYHIERKVRNQRNGHNSCLVWLTGLSGSGKSTIASGLEKKLFEKGISTFSLDGDNIRSGLNKDLGFSEEGRHENLRRIAEVAKLMTDAGLVVVAAFISPLEKDRDMLKEIVGKENFIEVFINTPLEICEQSDTKGLYKKARAGEIQNFTGIGAPYEPPSNPNLEVRTEEEAPEEA
ncbi:MAG: adenylyl-sulfate kinase, partial [Salinimicrobium sp.]